MDWRRRPSRVISGPLGRRRAAGGHPISQSARTAAVRSPGRGRRPHFSEWPSSGRLSVRGVRPSHRYGTGAPVRPRAAPVGAPEPTACVACAALIPPRPQVQLRPGPAPHPRITSYTDSQMPGQAFINKRSAGHEAFDRVIGIAHDSHRLSHDLSTNRLLSTRANANRPPAQWIRYTR